MRSEKQKLKCLKLAVSNAQKHSRAGDPKKFYSQYIRYALGDFDRINFYTSKNAINLDRSNVIHDHVVPHNIVMGKLLKLNPINETNLKSIIYKYLVICKITKEEDRKLNSAGLKSKMPMDWNEDTDSIFARYEKVGIEICEKRDREISFSL